MQFFIEDEKLFEFMTKMYSEMQEGFKQVNNRIGKVDGKIDKLEKTTIKMEQEHGQKLDALFGGYKQNSGQLNRIEHEVAKDEEVILRRIK